VEGWCCRWATRQQSESRLRCVPLGQVWARCHLLRDQGPAAVAAAAAVSAITAASGEASEAASLMVQEGRD
jgi:hypothetical protein